MITYVSLISIVVLQALIKRETYEIFVPILASLNGKYSQCVTCVCLVKYLSSVSVGGRIPNSYTILLHYWENVQKP